MLVYLSFHDILLTNKYGAQTTIAFSLGSLFLDGKVPFYRYHLSVQLLENMNLNYSVGSVRCSFLIFKPLLIFFL